MVYRDRTYHVTELGLRNPGGRNSKAKMYPAPQLGKLKKTFYEMAGRTCKRPASYDY